MANIKSAIKRVNVNRKKNAENNPVRSKILTETKRLKALVTASKFDEAQKQLSVVFAILDSAAKSNIIHKNSANTKKASLSKLLDIAKKVK
ncbi:MAG: 30S ribosomal protein S20 [Clostridia bacterium]|nr:30S ribosomal protein S20 [Clostridia bacterium]